MRLAVALAAFCLLDYAAERPRIFITDSVSWQVSGGFAGAASGGTGAASGHMAGGARPQTVELIKTFGERCKSVTVTMDKTKAQFVILFDYEGGKGMTRKHSKIAVFKNGGDVVYAGSTRSLGNAVKDACSAIGKSL